MNLRCRILFIIGEFLSEDASAGSHWDSKASSRQIQSGEIGTFGAGRRICGKPPRSRSHYVASLRHGLPWSRENQQVPMSFVENCCVFVILREGKDSSESCLLLLPIAKKSVEVLKEKVL